MKIASVGQNSYQRKVNTNLKKDGFAAPFKMSRILKNLGDATPDQLRSELTKLNNRLRQCGEHGGSENIKRLKAAKAEIENILNPSKKVEPKQIVYEEPTPEKQGRLSWLKDFLLSSSSDFEVGSSEPPRGPDPGW